MKDTHSSLFLFLIRTMPIGVAALIAGPTAVLAETQPTATVVAPPTVTTVAPVSTTTAPVSTTPSVATTPAVTTPAVGTGPSVVASPSSPALATSQIGTPDLTAVQNRAINNLPIPIAYPYSPVNPSYYSSPVAYPYGNPVVPPGYPTYPVNASAPAAPANNGQTIQVTTSVSLPYQTNAPAASPSPVMYPSIPVQSPYPVGASTYPYGTVPQGNYGVPSGYPYGTVPPGSYGVPGNYPVTLPASVGSGVYQQPLNSNAAWLQQLMEANRLYRSGQTQQAAQIYRQVRAQLENQSNRQAIDDVIINPDNLPDSVQSTWEQLLSQGKPTSQSLQSLRSLVQTYPQFMPGYLKLAQALEASGRRTEALSVLDRAVALFPDQIEVVRARVQTLTRSNRASDAAIAALQFSVQNPNSPYAAEFKTLAENAMKQTQTTNQPNQTRNLILGSVLQGGLNYLLTGQTSGPLSAIQGIFNMLRGVSTSR